MGGGETLQIKQENVYLSPLWIPDKAVVNTD